MLSSSPLIVFVSSFAINTLALGFSAAADQIALAQGAEAHAEDVVRLLAPGFHEQDAEKALASIESAEREKWEAERRKGQHQSEQILKAGKGSIQRTVQNAFQSLREAAFRIAAWR